MKHNFLFFFTFIIVLTTLVTASQVPTKYGFNLLPVKINETIVTFVNNTNFSNYWITDIGTLGTVNSTQFNNNDGTLNIDVAWINDNWCELTGCNMSGNIDLGGNDITNGGDGTFQKITFDNGDESAPWITSDGSGNLGIVSFENIDIVALDTVNVAGINGNVNVSSDIVMNSNDLLNVTNITLIDSIKDSDSDSRTYFDDEGAFVVEA